MNVRKGSLKHQIAEEIRKAIFRGDLKPGEKVTELKLSKDFEVSRGPIREAMQLLVMEGLLVSTTFKETKVANITSEEANELLVPIRINIETFALKKGFPLWGQQHFEQFEEVLEQMRRAANFNDTPLFSDLDMQFHELIVRSSNMYNVKSLWDSVLNRSRLLFIYENDLPFDLQKYTEFHRTLLDSFKTGDLDFAIRTLKDHIIQSNSLNIEFPIEGDK
ncbi:GntR family transcriptional regulator [Lentibacillus halophilus]